MTICIKCGGTALVPFDPNCEHEGLPTPSVDQVEHNREMIWRAQLPLHTLVVAFVHPLKEVAIQRCQEEWLVARKEAAREEFEVTFGYSYLDPNDGEVVMPYGEVVMPLVKEAGMYECYVISPGRGSNMKVGDTVWRSARELAECCVLRTHKELGLSIASDRGQSEGAKPIENRRKSYFKDSLESPDEAEVKMSLRRSSNFFSHTYTSAATSTLDYLDRKVDRK